MRFAVSVLLGIAIFAAGFRWTDEVTVIVALMILTSGMFAFLWPHRAWLWGLGIGIGTRISDLMPAGSILHEPPLSPEHIAREGASKPLPLPFGLMANPFAEWLAGSLLIMAFPMAGACVGWILRRGSEGVKPHAEGERIYRHD
jgi:hypothetical protein